MHCQTPCQNVQAFLLADSAVVGLCTDWPRPLVFATCSAADTTGRGIVNFGQTLVWYTGYLLSTRKQRQASSRQLLEQLEAQQWQ